MCEEKTIHIQINTYSEGTVFIYRIYSPFNHVKTVFTHSDPGGLGYHVRSPAHQG